MGQIQEFGAFGGASVEFQRRGMASLSHHFDFLPGNAADAEAEGLRRGFLGGESGGEAVCLAVAEGQFLGRIDSVEKAVSVAFYDPLDTWNFYNIYAGDEHVSGDDPTDLA